MNFDPSQELASVKRLHHVVSSPSFEGRGSAVLVRACDDHQDWDALGPFVRSYAATQVIAVELVSRRVDHNHIR
jgi:hypothetical protein